MENWTQVSPSFVFQFPACHYVGSYHLMRLPRLLSQSRSSCEFVVGSLLDLRGFLQTLNHLHSLCFLSLLVTRFIRHFCNEIEFYYLSIAVINYFLFDELGSFIHP